jgi:proteasome lid subunit RPN8/RPN11
MSWGERLSEQEIEGLEKRVLQVLLACKNHPDIDVIEIRKDKSERPLVVIDASDCTFDVPNDAGIRRTERLALRYQLEEEYPWGVFALRSDFPLTVHQNDMPDGKPRYLCLYAQSWSSIERTWTPEKFLKQVLWWLRATVEGTIHPGDQPLEQLFFTSPFHIMLPADVFSDTGETLHALTFSSIQSKQKFKQILIGKCASNNKIDDNVSCLPIFVQLPSVSNGKIESIPINLAQLQERIFARGSDMIEPLRTAVKNYINGGKKIDRNKKQLVLIVTVTPRERDGEIEKLDLHGFVLQQHIGELGRALGVVLKTPTESDMWYVDTLLGGNQEDNDSWKQIDILPLSVSQFPGRSEIHKYSGHQDADNDLNCMLAGVGALGSALALIWEKEGWGYWHYVDDDIVQPHNLVRHTAMQGAAGHPKSLVVDIQNSDIHSPPLLNQTRVKRSFVCSILSDESSLKEEIAKKDLLVDATTTLYVPRELSNKECPRVATVFLTPSGMSSVMLLENKDRTIRANHLEAQYYRAIIESGWGEAHLEKNLSSMWVGAGCREATVAMSYELIMTHAANLARRVRLSVRHEDAMIGVWSIDEETGAISAEIISPALPKQVTVGDWTVIWDSGIESILWKLRTQNLPGETGGVLLGIVDQKDKTICVVTATNAPEGSTGSATAFSRASAKTYRDTANSRTAGIVDYVGDWHSHPKGHGVTQSDADVHQLAYIGVTLLSEGLPALMMIVSDDQLGISVLNDGAEGASHVFLDFSVNL